MTEVCRYFCQYIHWTMKNSKAFFCPKLPDFRKSIAFWQVPRLRPFVLLLRATYWRRWQWDIGGMILTGKKNTEVLGKNLCQCQFVRHKSHKDWPGVETGSPAVTGQGLFLDFLALNIKDFSKRRELLPQHYVPEDLNPHYECQKMWSWSILRSLKELNNNTASKISCLE
jgi:hypothetical protein